MTSNPALKVLNQDDYEYQRQQTFERGPALHSWLDGRTPYWESYNQWLCFPVESVEVTCLNAEYNGVVQVPTIHVVQAQHYFEISMDPDPKPDCAVITHRWRELLQDQREFCVYAAPLQEYDGVLPDSRAKDGSVWIINRVKTASGYWDFSSPDNWLPYDE